MLGKSIGQKKYKVGDLVLVKSVSIDFGMNRSKFKTLERWAKACLDHVCIVVSTDPIDADQGAQYKVEIADHIDLNVFGEAQVTDEDLEPVFLL